MSPEPSAAIAAPLPGRADTVDVRYHGPVNLAGYSCALPSSSFVGRVCYDARNRYMVIQLSGTYYHYCGIDGGTVSRMLAADSVGRFYSTQVRGRFDCRITMPPR